MNRNIACGGRMRPRLGQQDRLCECTGGVQVLAILVLLWSVCLCSTSRAATLSVEEPRFDVGRERAIAANGALFHAEITEAILSAGYNSGSSGDTDFTVLPIVRETAVLYATPRVVEVTVEWQVRVTPGGPVIYTVVTRGFAQAPASSFSTLGAAALQDSAVRFAARPGLKAALDNPALLTLERTMSGRDGDTFHIRRCEGPSRKLPTELAETFDAVVVVKVGHSVGSGVVVSPDGFVLTAAHVVSPSSPVEVITHNGDHLAATVVRWVPDQDVALLRVVGLQSACLHLASQAPKMGTELYAVGTPAGLEYSVSRGIVSGYRSKGDIHFIQTDVSLSPGSSGGPLLNNGGQVVALVSWKVNASGFEGLGFGVPTAVVLDRLKVSLAPTTDMVIPKMVGEPAAALDAAFVDVPDESRYAAAVAEAEERGRNLALRRYGLAVAGLSGAAVAGTGWVASRMETAEPETWSMLKFGNSAAWIGLVGGTVLVGLTLTPFEGATSAASGP